MSRTKCDDDGITLDDLQNSGKTFGYDYVKRIFEKKCMKVMKPLCYLEDEGKIVKMCADLSANEQSGALLHGVPVVETQLLPPPVFCWHFAFWDA